MHQQLNLTPRRVQTPGVILNRLGNNINGSILVGIVSIWVTHKIAKKMFSHVSTWFKHLTASKHRHPEDARENSPLRFPHISQGVMILRCCKNWPQKKRQDGFGISQGRKPRRRSWCQWRWQIRTASASEQLYENVSIWIKVNVFGFPWEMHVLKMVKILKLKTTEVWILIGLKAL